MRFIQILRFIGIKHFFRSFASYCNRLFFISSPFLNKRLSGTFSGQEFTVRTETDWLPVRVIKKHFYRFQLSFTSVFEKSYQYRYIRRSFLPIHENFFLKLALNNLLERRLRTLRPTF